MSMLSQFRLQFPSLTERVHLASCSYTPRSTWLAGALDQMLQELEHERPWSIYEQKVVELRATLAQLLGCEARQIGLQPNATIAAYQVASSIDWSKRPRILSSTAEFPSILQVWKAQERRGAQLTIIDHAAHDALEVYRRTLDERVGLVSIPAVDYVSGVKLPVQALAALAARSGALSACDAYQWIGTEPVEVPALGVDYLLGGSMKYLLGLPGLAFLYARRPDEVQRVSNLTGWQGRVEPFGLNPLSLDAPPSARRFETGTPAIASIYAALGGVRALLDLGLARVAARITDLKQHARRVFAAQALDLPDFDRTRQAGAHIGVRVRDAMSLDKHLRQHRLQVSPRHGVIRVAFHAFNVREDVERLGAVLSAARAEFL